MSRSYPLFALVVLAGCGTGRISPSEDTGAAPAPAAYPPEVSPAPAAPAAAATPPAPDPGGPAAYVPYGGGTSLEIRRIGQWSQTGVVTARRLVIRDAAAWARLWSELGAGARPEIDFGRYLVIAVAAGQRSQGGHAIEVERVGWSEGELTIGVVESSPGPGCVTTEALTQPVDVVVAATANARSWSFVERKEVRSCR